MQFKRIDVNWPKRRLITLGIILSDVKSFSRMYVIGINSFTVKRKETFRAKCVEEKSF